MGESGGFQFTSELEDSHALRLVSKLPDLRAANANPCLASKAVSKVALSATKKSTHAIA